MGELLSIDAVGTESGQYHPRTMPLEQFLSQVRKQIGGLHLFDADPRLFRMATEALRTHMAHLFDPQFAVSVSQVDPLPH